MVDGEEWSPRALRGRRTREDWLHSIPGRAEVKKEGAVFPTRFALAARVFASCVWLARASQVLPLVAKPRLQSTCLGEPGHLLHRPSQAKPAPARAKPASQTLLNFNSVRSAKRTCLASQARPGLRSKGKPSMQPWLAKQARASLRQATKRRSKPGEAHVVSATPVPAMQATLSNGGHTKQV